MAVTSPHSSSALSQLSNLAWRPHSDSQGLPKGFSVHTRHSGVCCLQLRAQSNLPPDLPILCLKSEGDNVAGMQSEPFAPMSSTSPSPSRAGSQSLLRREAPGCWGDTSRTDAEGENHCSTGDVCKKSSVLSTLAIYFVFLGTEESVSLIRSYK